LGARVQETAGQREDLPEEASQTYKELFEDPDNEWNAEFESDGGNAESFMDDLDNPGVRHLIDGDGFNAGDVDDWHNRSVVQLNLPHTAGFCGT
jgi:hypothetical protein